MPTSRILGKYKKKYLWKFSSKIKEEATGFAKKIRSSGQHAQVRKGGRKWDVFGLN